MSDSEEEPTVIPRTPEQRSNKDKATSQRLPRRNLTITPSSTQPKDYVENSLNTQQQAIHLANEIPRWLQNEQSPGDSGRSTDSRSDCEDSPGRFTCGGKESSRSGSTSSDDGKLLLKCNILMPFL